MQFHMREWMSKALDTKVDEKLNVSALFRDSSDVTDAGPLEVKLVVKGYEQFIAVDGELTTDLELVCSRCLEPVKETITFPFHERFKPEEEPQDEDNADAEWEEDFAFVASERLDLKPYLEEALLLSVPFAPLCAPACKGLCQQCGQNLNEKQCDCKQERIDPRLAALNDFFKQ